MMSDGKEILRLSLNSFETYSAPPCNLSFFIFYESEISTEFMKQRLDEAIVEIPLLSSVVVLEKEDSYCFECVKPSNITITKKEVPEELFKKYFPDEEGILSFEEGEEFCKLLDSCEIDPPTTKIRPKVGVPLFKVTIMNNTKLKKSIIGYSINHMIVDAHSAALVVHHLSKGEKCKMFDDPYQFVRPKCLISDLTVAEDYPSKEDSKYLDKLKIYHPFGGMKKEEIGVGLSSDCVQRIIRFSGEKVKELKSLVNSKTNERFSSHDCICALMWMFFASYISSDDNEKIQLNVVMSLRNRAKDIGAGYFGNAVVIPSTDLTRGEIFKSTFSDLVMKVRDVVNTCDERMATIVHNCLEKYKETMIGYHRKKCVIMNDWRIFDRLNMDISSSDGVVKCERKILWPKDQHAMVYTNMWFTNLTDDGGFEVKCYLDRKDYERVKMFDFTSIEDVRKMKDL